MWGRKRVTRLVGVLAALLAAVCLLGLAAQGRGDFTGSTVFESSPASQMLSEDTHDYPALQDATAATRIRQILGPLPAPLPMTPLFSALLGAALLALWAARGAVFSRAPDNPGRQHLITLGIDRR